MRFLSILIAVFLTNVCFADVKVIGVRSWNSGSTFVLFKATGDGSVAALKSNCSIPGFYYISTNNDLAKQAMISIALAAQASGKGVSIHIEGCVDGYPNLAMIQINN